jgi:hypothetical protein
MKNLIQLLVFTVALWAMPSFAQIPWSSEFVFYGQGGRLQYLPGDMGDILPDFSQVGYHFGDDPIPDVPVIAEITPSGGDDRLAIQSAIESLYNRVPDSQGFRGAVLLKKGTYKVSGSIQVNKSGIVLRGEGDDDNGTIIIATGTDKRNLINVGTAQNLVLDQTSRTKIKESYVPVGRKFVVAENPENFQEGDLVAIHRPGTSQWISDIRMDQISGADAQQWSPSTYTFNFERVITGISMDTLFFRNPIVMAMEDKYGGGYVMKCSMNRIDHVGIENMQFRSEFKSETDEEHSWNAIWIYNAEHSWVRNVTSLYFAYSCVTVGRAAKHISVLNSQCLDPKSLVTGSRRYSFNLEGQLSLFKNCHTSGGRHDYVTSSRVCGPSVFTQSTAVKTNADIGPHHRWAMGILFDKIVSDGEIRVQDRDNSGSGHGWSGVNQVFWNCKGSGSTCQSPWVSGKNYNIGFQGNKLPGQWQPNRPDGEWEGHNLPGLFPASLYEAQLKDRSGDARVFSVYSRLVQFSDSSFVLSFNLDVHPADMGKASVISVSGTSGAGSKEWEVRKLDDSKMEITFRNLGILPHNSTIVVKADGVRSAVGDTLTGLKQAIFTEPDKRPRVTSAYQETTNGPNAYARAMSSKKGKLYLVRMGVPTASVNNLEAAVSSANGAVAEVTEPDSETNIYTRHLNFGLYYVYAVDADGRISARSANMVYVRLFTTAAKLQQADDNHFHVFSTRSALIIRPATDRELPYHLEVFDIHGRLIFIEKNIRGDFYQKLPGGGKTLLVRIVQNDRMVVRKLILQ